MPYVLGPENVREHLDSIAGEYDAWKEKNAYYYGILTDFVRKHVHEGSTVLQVGCNTGDILASVRPRRGLGIDLSEKLIEIAREKYPALEFRACAAQDLVAEEKFDHIILVNVLEYTYDVNDLFKTLHRFCKPTTEIIVATINPWWQPLFSAAERMKAKMPMGPMNFLEKRNLTKMMEYLDYSISYSGYLGLLPKRVPLLSFLLNRVCTRVWGLNKFSVNQYMVLRALPGNDTDLGLGCSVVIPCYNEAGNIEEAVRRVPRMGSSTEVIVVDDGSTDGTAEIVRRLQVEMPDLRLISYSPNEGKGSAVTKGFDAAEKDVIMILDADMSVMPEELPRFFELLNKGVCSFVNGTRMMYPMQDAAMKFLNLLGNKVFGLMMTFIVGQHLTDTLCGTKAMYRKDYAYIQMGLDKWGDFDLLFGAAKNGNKIVEMPVHYMARKADLSKMKTLSHGLHLMKVCIRGFRELVLGL